MHGQFAARDGRNGIVTVMGLARNSPCGRTPPARHIQWPSVDLASAAATGHDRREGHRRPHDRAAAAGPARSGRALIRPAGERLRPRPEEGGGGRPPVRSLVCGSCEPAKFDGAARKTEAGRGIGAARNSARDEPFGTNRWHVRGKLKAAATARPAAPSSAGFWGVWRRIPRSKHHPERPRWPSSASTCRTINGRNS